MTFNDFDLPYFVVNPDEYSSEGAHSPERLTDIPCKNWDDWGFGFQCNLGKAYPVLPKHLLKVKSVKM